MPYLITYLLYIRYVFRKCFRTSFQLLVRNAEIFNTAQIILRKEMVKIRSNVAVSITSYFSLAVSPTCHTYYIYIVQDKPSIKQFHKKRLFLTRPEKNGNISLKEENRQNILSVSLA